MSPISASQLHGKSFSSTVRQTSPTQTSGLDFAPAVTYGSGGYFAWPVVVADVNGDGKPDIVVANANSGTVGVLLGNGDGTFQPVVNYSSGGLPTSVAVSDVNGDGKPDIVVTNPGCGVGVACSGTVGVLLGNGDGTFQPVVNYSSGGYSDYGVAVADVNGDGKPDLLVANWCATLEQGLCVGNGVVGVLLGNGDGTFQTAAPYSSGGVEAFSVAVADVNRDGKPDIVVANWCTTYNDYECNGSGIVGVLLGNGDGTFQPVVNYSSGGEIAYSVAVADVNGDGKPDIVVGNVDSATVAVLLGNGDGTFQTAVPYSSGGSAVGVAVADVNGDGKPDIVVVCEGSAVGVLLGNGDGTFQSVVNYSSGGYIAYSVAVADVNGDGKPDIVVANLCTAEVNGSCAGYGAMGVLINISTYPTTTTLTSSSNPSAFGQSVIFTATVTQQFGKGTPTGTVSFFDGLTSLGSSSLNSSGVATFTTSTIAVGTNSITATYNGNSNSGLSTSPVLSQVVQGAIAQVSPSSLNFGNQTVGIASTSQAVTLTNTGNATLTITSIAVSLSNGSYTETNTCGTSLSAGASCTVSLTWTPGNTGNMTGNVAFTDNAPGSPQTASLRGVGVVPRVTFSPATLTFATQVVFTTSPAQTVTLNNTGLGVLSITKVSVTGAFTQTNTCGTSVAAGASCTFSVKFKPTMSGTLTGAVSITDNASGSPQKITLTGTGTDIQLTPTSLNFGNQPVGTKSLPKKITLSNKASVNVSITSISIAGTDSKDFAETNTCGTTVKAGASCKITVTFTPSVDGKRTADVSISDNGGGSPQTVTLSGTGTGT